MNYWFSRLLDSSNALTSSIYILFSDFWLSTNEQQNHSTFYIMNIGDKPFKFMFNGVNSPGAAAIGSEQIRDEMSFDDCIKLKAYFKIS